MATDRIMHSGISSSGDGASHHDMNTDLTAAAVRNPPETRRSAAAQRGVARLRQSIRERRTGDFSAARVANLIDAPDPTPIRRARWRAGREIFHYRSLSLRSPAPTATQKAMSLLVSPSSLLSSSLLPTAAAASDRLEMQLTAPCRRRADQKYHRVSSLTAAPWQSRDHSAQEGK